jgi:hypothetical protein
LSLLSLLRFFIDFSSFFIISDIGAGAPMVTPIATMPTRLATGLLGGLGPHAQASAAAGGVLAGTDGLL